MSDKKQSQEDFQLDLEPEVLQSMLKEKAEENLKLQELLNSTKQELLNIKTRALNVHEKNRLYEADPDLASEMARMEFHMKLAQQFITSKAFKASSPEQAYVIIKAGAEMGMKPVESMQALYCVNGAVRFYGDKMLARITKEGYKVEYKNETAKSVEVRVFHPEFNFDVTEKVNDTDQILQNSKAVKFAKKNKMRFHGIRMIASFHLAHLFNSVEDEFSSDFRNWDDSSNLLENKKQDTSARKRILNHIQKAKDNLNEEMLRQVEGHKAEYDVVEEFDEALKYISSHSKSTNNEK